MILKENQTPNGRVRELSQKKVPLQRVTLLQVEQLIKKIPGTEITT